MPVLHRALAGSLSERSQPIPAARRVLLAAHGAAARQGEMAVLNEVPAACTLSGPLCCRTGELGWVWPLGVLFDSL